MNPASASERWTPQPITLDPWLLVAAVSLLSLGWVMVASASITFADSRLGQPFFYLLRQSIFIGIGLACGWMAFRTPLDQWRQLGPWLFVLGVVLLAVVLVPGIGREVNGSMRWIGLGPATAQPGELMKLFTVLYLAGYLVRREVQVRTTLLGFLKPVAGLAAVATLLLLEPDFGAAVILLATAMGMLFLAGVRLWQFLLLGLLGGAAAAWLAISSSYRLERLTAFLDPWADPFDSGFQLTQALIAFGRGEWLGVGLGGSVQKLFYLPEAHTDFLFAVLAEELGLLGVLGVVALFTVMIWRAFLVAARAYSSGLTFGAHLAWGVGICLALQALINVGVNMGALPTKGLTLPLMSYGGNSVVVACVMVALLLRVDLESRVAQRAGPPEGSAWQAV